MAMPNLSAPNAFSMPAALPEEAREDAVAGVNSAFDLPSRPP